MSPKQHRPQRLTTKSRLTLLLTVSLSLAAALPLLVEAALQSSATRPSERKQKRAEFIPGEILVRFRKDAAATKVARAEMTVVENGRQIPLQVERLDGPEIVEGLRLARVAPEDEVQAIEALKTRPDVLYAEPNYIRRKSITPNDNSYGELWGLKNIGQQFGTPGADIKAEQAWDITTGSRGIVVAVIDEGIDIHHQDLQANIWRNPGEIQNNGIDDDGNGFVDDLNGYDFFHNDATVYDGPGTNPDGSVIDAHGTHVAGIIGAVGNNGIGVVGVNWQVSLMSLKFLGPDGGSSADLIRAFSYAKLMRDRWVSSGGTQGANIRVTNNSYGGDGYSQSEADAIQAMAASGVLFVAAAGNEAQDNVPSYPANYDLPSVISVAATDRYDNLAYFSNRGSRSVLLGAPGDSILSTTPGNTYSVHSGTSMASPHVAGTAALVLAAHPDLTVTRLRAAVLFGGDQIASLAQTTMTGNRLSAAGSLQNAGESDTTPPAALGDLHIIDQNGRSVSLGWTATGDDGSSGQASLHEIRFVDQTGPARFLIGAQRPAPTGSQEFVEVAIPYRHTAGTITLFTYDNAGNSVTASVNISVSPDAAEPYTVTEGPPAPLSTGGNRLGLNYDDYVTSYSLPFNFPFFERFSSSVLLSTNGAIFLAPSQGSYDLPNEASRLSRFQMVAGLWDDLDLRTAARADADLYVLQPDANRIIFRWQGVPCNPNIVTGQCAGGGPVNFEIELQRDGTIVTRYGDGNTNLHPVVGIGGGEPDSYPIISHTSELAPKSLTNAPAVTFALKSQPQKADVKITTKGYPTTVVVGGNITYTATITNAGPDTASGVKVSDALPIVGSFVSCATSQGSCSGPPTGNSRLVSASLGTIASGASATVTIVARVTVLQSQFENTSTVSARTYDPDPFSNKSTTYSAGYLPNPNPITGMTAIAAGYSHYLAIAVDGSLLAWGSNNYGELGDGTTQARKTPIWVNGLNGVKSIAAGGAHSIAIKPSGSIWTWGSNTAGQLGDGTTTSRSTPGQVPGLTGVTAAAGGGAFTIALKNDGTVWTWGNNFAGQLGDNTTNGRSSPGVVNGLAGVVAVAAGSAHSVAVRNDGSVWTWGDNSQGQLGDGTTNQKATPTQVSGLTGITRVAAGAYFTVALKSDGTVWTWGSNSVGQLGNGTTSMTTVPFQVGGLTSVSAIAAGLAHTMALRSDGTIWAWGLNYSGQLGVGIDLSPTNYLTVPMPVIIVSGATAIAAGGEASLALATNGTVYLWGNSTRDSPYQVDAPLPRPTLEAPSFNPDGGTYSAAQAVTVSLPSNTSTVSSVALGSAHTLAAMSDGKVYAWGTNDSGQLALPGPFGAANYSSIPVLVSGIDSVKAVAAGDLHSLALKFDGTVWAWGSNQYGQSGTGNGSGDTNVPAQVVGLNNVAAIAARVVHSVALRGDGTVWTWGYNQYGALGDGTIISRATPVQVVGLTNVRAIAAGSEHNIAVKNDGTVWTWGYNRIGQLGDNTLTTRLIPVQVTTLTNVTAVAAGSVHTAALRGDGTVWVWGDNQYGEIGDGSNSSKFVPTQTVGLTGVSALAAGGETTAALRNDGSVWTWGQNFYGQLGTGFSPWSLVPGQVSDLSNISAISVGGAHVAAIRSNGLIWMWGYNLYGQLGDLTTSDRHAPVPLDFFTSGPAIHYTTNGSDPTDDDPVINSGATVPVDRNMVLKARVFRAGFAPSTIKSAAYIVGPQNPIDDARNFVRQHYLDFLSREPDQQGWDYWTDQITSCGSDQLCINARRIRVSDAFFFEPEFQQTGSYVFRLYRAAYGNNQPYPNPDADPRVPGLNVTLPNYGAFNQDRAQVVGGAGLARSQLNLANAFVQRPEFLAKYTAGLSAQEFINAVLATIQSADPSVDLSSEQSALTTLYNQGGRGAVIYRLADDNVQTNTINNRAFIDAEYNRTFVTVEYFGYLRRDADTFGLNFWLGQLNRFPLRDINIQHAMVCSFITSIEYQQRFGSTVSHTNAECPQ